jgi:hypothetical protein
MEKRQLGKLKLEGFSLGLHLWSILVLWFQAKEKDLI